MTNIKKTAIRDFGNYASFQKIIVVIFLVSFLSPIVARGNSNLTHEMTDWEKTLMPSYLESQEYDSRYAPIPPVRNIAEYESMEGVLIAYPLGIPTSIVKEMAEDTKVYTIVSNSSKKQQAINTYDSAGVNLSNCKFIIAPTDSYWTRDYGPWYVSDGYGEIGIVDFIYNRPRPNDNNIPNEIAGFFNVDVFKMGIVAAGGNWMTDGSGIAASTDLVWNENDMSQQQIYETVDDYLGIEKYYVKKDPQGEYIKHIDCWGKFLDVDKILIAKVPNSSPRYIKYEQIATFFARQTSAWGNKYKVYRVYCANGQPYTNSLILNRKVLVPITGSSGDSTAINAYKKAMPGYEVLGFKGNWQSTDALHCRTKGVADRNMLYIDHMPILGQKPAKEPYDVSAEIIPYSGYAVDDSSVNLFYRINGGTYASVNMSYDGGNTYTGTIPGQPGGSKIGYYIHAEDEYGKTASHPFIGAPDPHVFKVTGSEPPPPPGNSDTLQVGEKLKPGETLISANGNYSFRLQTSGNMVLKNLQTNKILWMSKTGKKSPRYLILKSNGNLLLYSTSGKRIWRSRTAGSGATELVLNNNGSLVLYKGNKEVWSRD